jgi:hypothetical protein
MYTIFKFVRKVYMGGFPIGLRFNGELNVEKSC